MKGLFFFCFIVFSIFANAQNNLLSLLSKNDEPIYISYHFKGTKVVSSQSVEIPANGVLQLMIQHRFGPLSSGLYNFYGLDNAQVRIGVDYGYKNWMSFGLGRSSNTKTIDGSFKLRIKRQQKQAFPFTIVFNSAIFIDQWQYSESQLKSFAIKNQLNFMNQFLLAKKINRNFTFQLMPTMLHDNVVRSKNESNDKFSLGFGSRQKLTKRLTLNCEYFFQVNEKINPNVLSLGFDIETGGHIFQFHLSNSLDMIDKYFITQVDGDWLNGNIYFGFNISRVFNLRSN